MQVPAKTKIESVIQVFRLHATDLLTPVVIGLWHAAEKPVERKRLAGEDGGRAGSRHGDLKGNHEGKLVSLERRRRTTTEVRRRLEPLKVLERRACRVLDQPHNAPIYRLSFLTPL